MRVTQPSRSCRPEADAACDPLTRAYLTLLSGCSFWERHAPIGDKLATGRRSTIVARLTGNRLRELDRFLSVLLDEAALRHGGPGHDRRAFARQRNTPRKLIAVARMMDLDGPSIPRLRAIGRISACLHHCSGVIHAPALRNDLRLATGRDVIDDEYPRLFLSAESIAAICHFYRQIGGGLVRDAVREGAALTCPGIWSI